MSLLTGNSTIPSAPARFRAGMICRTTVSSTILEIETQSGSESDGVVGLCKAGRRSTIASQSLRLAFIMSPTFPSASNVARSSRAISSIFCFFQGSANACGLAMNREVLRAFALFSTGNLAKTYRYPLQRDLRVL